MADDFAVALQLQEQLYRESDDNDDILISDGTNGFSFEGYVDNSSIGARKTSGVNSVSSLCDESWELVDPSPDAWALFVEFNKKYFWGKLTGVELRWSARMTLCAGLCVYEGRGGLCCIKLSEPLLKFRPRKDLVETLLHEMIHAYLFVTNNDRDREGHGPEFLKHMHRLNAETGAKITVYHSFHDEVDLYRQHWWRCNGPCRARRPFFGFVRRAMNRAPSERDPWFADHQRTCGGLFIKIKEPEGYGVKKSKSTDKVVVEKPVADAKPSNTLDNWYNSGNKGTSVGYPNAGKARGGTAQASAGSARQVNLDDIDLDSMSDDDLVSAVDKFEDSFREENEPVSAVPSGSSEVVFPGNGYVLSTDSSQSKLKVGNSPIVRRLPGLGIITGRSKSITNDDVDSSYVDFRNQKSQSEDNCHVAPARNGLQKAETQSSGSVKREVKTVHVLDLSDSDDDFNKMMAGRRSNRKVTASDYASKVFGNGIPKRGAVVHVKNFRSVSNPKATPSSGCKDFFLRDRFKVSAGNREDADETRPAKRHRGDASSEGSSQQGLGRGKKTSEVDSTLSNVPRVEDRETPTLVENGNRSQGNSELDCAASSSRTSKSSASVSNSNAGRPRLSENARTSQSQAETASVGRIPVGQGDTVAADALVNCPVCQRPVEAASINDHLDQCENAETSPRPNTPQLQHQNDAAAAASSGALVECPVCQQPIAVSFINQHLDQCLA